MKEQETRETFRDYALNDRAIYDSIEHPARLLASNLETAIQRVNKNHAANNGGAVLISTDADKQAAISVFLAEVGELLQWELIGKYNAR